MSEYDQIRVLRVSDRLLMDVDGRSFIDEHGRVLTISVRSLSGGEADVAVGVRTPPFRERLRMAIRFLRDVPVL